MDHQPHWADQYAHEPGDPRDDRLQHTIFAPPTLHPRPEAHITPLGAYDDQSMGSTSSIRCLAWEFSQLAPHDSIQGLPDHNHDASSLPPPTQQRATTFAQHDQQTLQTPSCFHDSSRFSLIGPNDENDMEEKVEDGVDGDDDDQSDIRSIGIRSEAEPMGVYRLDKGDIDTICPHSVMSMSD